jgi:MoaA/NifB/PqqE/SkfB family radical SAM enzyme
MNARLDRLPILILYPHSRCNCRCVMCDIWKSTDSLEMSAEDLEKHLTSLETMGVEWVVFSGGEPLMHTDLFRLCAQLKSRGIRTTLLSTGLLLRRHAQGIVDWLDDVIVSLDGSPAIHDQIRGVPFAFQTLQSGVKAIRALSPDFPITARCTVQHLNCGALDATIESARSLGLNGISFLAADVTSEAFNRPGGWQPNRQSAIALSEEDIPVLKQQIESLIRQKANQGFVAESPAKLQRIVQHFRAHHPGAAEPQVAPRCNAPWVSAVVESDGTVRPCFFHPAIGKATEADSLLDVLNSDQAIRFRQRLDVASNPICRRCVCSLNWKPSMHP